MNALKHHVRDWLILTTVAESVTEIVVEVFSAINKMDLFIYCQKKTHLPTLLYSAANRATGAYISSAEAKLVVMRLSDFVDVTLQVHIVSEYGWRQ